MTSQDFNSKMSCWFQRNVIICENAMDVIYKLKLLKIFRFHLDGALSEDHSGEI